MSAPTFEAILCAKAHLNPFGPPNPHNKEKFSKLIPNKKQFYQERLLEFIISLHLFL